MISLFTGRLDPWPKQGPATVASLLAFFATPLPDGKAKDDYPAWSPARWPANARRAKAAVEDVSCLVADVDDGTPFEDAVKGLPDVCYLAHSSYSHTPEHPKYRIVIPLAAPVPADLFPRAWAWLRERVPCMDAAVSDASRIYYPPVARPGAWSSSHEGPLLEAPNGSWASLPDPTPRTKARPPTTWSPTVDRPTWSPRPEDYAADLVRRAVESWHARLATHVTEIRALTSGRRTAIRAAAFYMARYAWLREDLLRTLDEALRGAAGDRLDENITTLLEACMLDAANDPGPIEDLVAPGLEGAALPIVVKRGSSVWVLTLENTSYEGPGDATDALGWLRARSDVVVTRKGRTLPWNDVFGAYGTTARDVVYAYPRPDGTIPRVWDPATKTLATTRAHRPVVVPRKHAQVATWLGCGLAHVDDETRDRVLDWLVTAWGAWLDHPSACLYLEGPGGGGKTMLAHALASVWRQPPVPMGTGMQQFNEPLLRCPILHLDEGEGTSDVSSDSFRMTLSIRAHRVELKGGAVVSLHSAIRGIITANNGRALTFPAIPTFHDLDAIAERILHVTWSDSARLYLAKLGEGGTRGWVTAPDGGPGKIAEHIAWLATTRTVRPGSRWVVSGIRGRYHESLVLQVPLSGAILAGVVAGTRDRTFVAVEGGWSVKAQTLQERWLSLVRDGSRQPTMHALTDGLEALSRSHAAGTWVVDGGLVDTYAKSLGLEVGPA